MCGKLGIRSGSCLPHLDQLRELRRAGLDAAMCAGQHQQRQQAAQAGGGVQVEQATAEAVLGGSGAGYSGPGRLRHGSEVHWALCTWPGTLLGGCWGIGLPA